MKRRFYQEILDETTVELKTGYQETIDRLRQLAFGSRYTDCVGRRLSCYCDEKGRILVSNDLDRDGPLYTEQGYYVRGEVMEEDGRTKVHIYTIRDKGNRLLRHLSVARLAVVTAVSAVLAAVSLLLGATVSTAQDLKFLLSVPMGMLLLGAIVLRAGKRKKHETADLSLMKEVILERLEAVEKWDE